MRSRRTSLLSVVPNEFEIIKQKYILVISFLIPFWTLATYIIFYSMKRNIFYTRREENDISAKYKEE
jgi:hypothetical protein